MDNDDDVSIFIGNLRTSYTANDLQTWLENNGVTVNKV